MKIQISSKELQRTLGTVAKVIQKKNTLAILDCAKLWEKDGQYLLTASDSENEITVAVQLSLIDGEFIPVCIRVDSLLPALTNLAEQPLNITVESNGDAMPTIVEYLGGQFSIVSYPATEYPVMKDMTDSVTSFDIETNILLPVLKAASNNTGSDDLRPIMCGVLLDVTVDSIIFVASDGHRLYKYSIYKGVGFAIGQNRLVLPRTVLSAIDNAFRGSEYVHFEADNQYVVISSDETRFMLRQIEGKYPNYNSVIPKNNSYHAVIDVKTFISAIKRVSLFSSSTEQVNLKFNDMFCELSSEDIDYSRSSREQIDVSDKNIPNDFTIGLKAPNILQHLSTINTDKVRVELSSPDKAVILKDDDPNSPLLLMVMPMLIQ